MGWVKISKRGTNRSIVRIGKHHIWIPKSTADGYSLWKYRSFNLLRNEAGCIGLQFFEDGKGDRKVSVGKKSRGLTLFIPSRYSLPPGFYKLKREMDNFFIIDPLARVQEEIA